MDNMSSILVVPLLGFANAHQYPGLSLLHEPQRLKRRLVGHGALFGRLALFRVHLA